METGHRTPFEDAFSIAVNSNSEHKKNVHVI